MRKLKILQTPVRFYPFVGGVENHVLYLSKELVKLGHEVKVVCANEHNKDIKEIDGIKVSKLNYYGKVANTNLTLSLPFKLLKENFDIMHTHMPTPWSADVSAIISKIKRRPVVLTYHNDLIKKGFSRIISELYNHTFLKFLLSISDKVIITQPNYLNSSKYLKNFKKKIFVIPNGVDTEVFKNDRTNKKNGLFFLSVLDKHHEYKGLDYLIKSMQIVKKYYPNLVLNIGGRGELVNTYKKLVKELSLEKNVKFVGYVSDIDLVKYYSSSQIFILPSIDFNEGFGIVALEALACKTPVIVTPIVGVSKEIKDDKCGLIVPPKDSKALADAIIKILKNRSLAKKMGENGRKLVEKKYSWDNVAKQIEKVYLEVKK